MWEIDKAFSFCYGHRVWSQKLHTGFTSNNDKNCKCRFLHGHEATVKVYLSADELTDGMVTDFKHLGWLDDFLDKHIDHKFILDLNDPWFAQIINAKPVWNGRLECLSATQPLNTMSGRKIQIRRIDFAGTGVLAGWECVTKDMSGCEEEFYEGFFLVNFCPTSENLSEWIAKGTQEKMKQLNVDVTRVDWNETPKSRAVYTVPPVED